MRGPAKGPGVPGKMARTQAWASRHSTSRSQRGPRRGRQASKPCPETQSQRPTSPDGTGGGAATAAAAVSGLAGTQRQQRRRRCRRRRCSRLGAWMGGSFDSVYRGSRRRPGMGALHGRVGRGASSLSLSLSLSLSRGRASGVRACVRVYVRSARGCACGTAVWVVLALSRGEGFGIRRRLQRLLLTGFGPPLALNGRPLFESKREAGSGPDGAGQGQQQLTASGGAGHGPKTPRSDKMLQCEPLLVILGIRSVAQHVAVPVRWEKLLERCRPVPSPLSLPAAWNGMSGQG